jgi:hypothetical protein
VKFEIKDMIGEKICDVLGDGMNMAFTSMDVKITE